MQTGPLPERLALAAAAIALAAALGGCGITDPDASGTTTGATATVTIAPDTSDPPAERGGTIPAPAIIAENRLAARAPRPTPEAALAHYARVYVNWSASTVLARQRQLAAISLGQAHAQALQAAASAQHDKLLAHSRVANTGSVVAIAPGQGAAAGEWVIVTREQTTGHGDYAGLPPTLHVTYAKLTRARHGWVVTLWQPQR